MKSVVIILNKNFIDNINSVVIDLKSPEYIIIPIDSESLFYCKKENLFFYHLEDIVKDQLFLNLKKIEESWSKYNFKKDIYNVFLKCDKEFMWILWQRLLISNYLCFYFKNNSIKKIIIFSKSLNFNNNVYESCDTHIDVFLKNNFSILNLYNNQQLRDKNSSNFKNFLIKSEFRKFKNKITEKILQKKEIDFHVKYYGKKIENKIVYVINDWDVNRVQNHLYILNSVHKDQFVLILISCKHSKHSILDKIGCSYINFSGIELFYERNLKKIFLDRLSVINKDLFRIDNLENLKVFTQIYSKHWNNFINHGNFWKKIFSKFKPVCLFTTTAPVWQIRLVNDTAFKLGIDTYTDSHGIGCVRPLFLKSKFFLTNYKFDENLLFRTNVNSFIRINDLNEEDEYCTKNIYKNIFDVNMFSTLFLTTTTGNSNCLNFSNSRKLLMESLKTITSLPPILSNNYQYGIKVHPGYPDINLLSLNDEIKKHILPVDINISSATNNVNLVVSLNYAGIGLLNCIKRNIPIILFWNNDFLENNVSTPFSNIFKEAGLFISQPSEFWPNVIELYQNKKFYNSLVNKVKMFKSLYIDDKNNLNFFSFTKSLRNKYYT